MRNILPFTFCALLAISYFWYPGTAGIAWYFALGAVFANLVALILAARAGFETCVIDSWYHCARVVANVFNILWICSIQYSEYVGTHYVFALVLPFGVAAMFAARVQKFLMPPTRS